MEIRAGSSRYDRIVGETIYWCRRPFPLLHSRVFFFPKDVTLFHTTILSGGTNEKATLSNSSMATSRVINFARSPNAQVYVYFKFSVEVKYEKIEIFHQALRSFVRARPREWANFGAFRSTKIMADLGYIEYVTFLVHVRPEKSIACISVLHLPHIQFSFSFHSFLLARSLAKCDGCLDKQSGSCFVWERIIEEIGHAIQESTVTRHTELTGRQHW